MHAFPSRERVFSQPLPRVQIDIKGKGAPQCWGDEPIKESEAETCNSAQPSAPTTPFAADTCEGCPTSPLPTPTIDPAASSPSPSPSPRSDCGLDNWLSVNRSFYPYYVTTFEFVSGALNSHQGQVQIADRRDHCREYLRALKHYLRADYSIVHMQQVEEQVEEKGEATAAENTDEAAAAATAAAELSSLTQSLAVVLTEYIFNVSFVHSGQHALLGHVDRQSKREIAAQVHVQRRWSPVDTRGSWNRCSFH